MYLHEARVYNVVDDHSRAIISWTRYRCVATTIIAELKELWEFGIETYDAHTNQTFQMRATLMWTISDFSAL